ncbi:hypothetical protein MMPV_005358 [Pyropia vietnamensis]
MIKAAWSVASAAVDHAKRVNFHGPAIPSPVDEPLHAFSALCDENRDNVGGYGACDDFSIESALHSDEDPTATVDQRWWEPEWEPGVVLPPTVAVRPPKVPAATAAVPPHFGWTRSGGTDSGCSAAEAGQTHTAAGAVAVEVRAAASASAMQKSAATRGVDCKPGLHTLVLPNSCGSFRGRDKLFALLQYTLRLRRALTTAAAASRLRRGKGEPPLPPPPAPGAALALEGALATSRQLWRLAKWVGVAARQRNPSADEGIAVDAALAIGDAALFAYLLLDNWALLCRVGVLRPAPGVGQRAARAWAVASGVALGVGLWRLGRAAARRQVAERERRRAAAGRPPRSPKSWVGTGGVADADAEVRRVAWTEGPRSVKAAADLVVATSNATQGGVNEVAVGSAGVVSALVGVWQVWPRV